MRVLCLLSLVFTWPVYSAVVDYKNVDYFKVIPIEIKGKTYQGIIDSGSNINVLSSELKDLVKDEKKISEKQVNTASGSKKAESFSLPTSVAGKKNKLIYILGNTRVSGECCDIILGKEWFDKHRIFIQSSTSKVYLDEANPPLPKEVKPLVLKTSKDSKEIVVDCKVKGEPTECRLDFGSLQAFEINTALAKKIVDEDAGVSLESLLQNGLSVANLPVQLGSIQFNGPVPMLYHSAQSASVLSSGFVGVNVGAPVLNSFDSYFHLAKDRIELYPKSIPPKVAINKWWVLLKESAEDGVVVKSVLAGSCADNRGIKVNDRLLSINGVENPSATMAYHLFEDPEIKDYKVKIKRNGRESELSFSCSSLMPDRVVYPSSFYGLREAHDKGSALIKVPTKSYDYARMITTNIETDFSFSEAQGIDAFEFLFKNFKIPLKFIDNKIKVEGLSLKDKEWDYDESSTMPSFSLGQSCPKIKKELVIKSSSESHISWRRMFAGCGKTLVLDQNIYFYTKEAMGSVAESSFGYLRDPETATPFRWKKKILLSIDDSFSTEERDDLVWAIRLYQSKAPFLKLDFQRIPLLKSPPDNVDVHGIYAYESEQTGHLYDRSQRFAVATVAGNPSSGEIVDADIVIRRVELNQFEQTLDALISAQEKKASPEIKAKLRAYRSQKLQQMRRNLFLHEIGHILGLSHNFSESEKSIMSYEMLTDLSSYDVAALDFLYTGKKPERSFEFQKSPSAHAESGPE